MRSITPRTMIGVALAVVAAAVLAAANAFAVSGGETASAVCSKATATQLVEQHNLNHFGLPNPVRQVLCGPFTGAGSQAMALTIGAPTCWGIQHWAVLALTNGAWRLVLARPAFLMPPLVAVGSGIRETTAVHGPGDARCFPSGGTRARIWRWNGSRLVAGPWKQVTKGDAESRGFISPSRNIDCGMFDESRYRYVRCQSRNPPQKVTLDDRGRATICIDSTPNIDNDCNLGDPGENVFPILAYGRQITVGRFRCLSLETGVRCTVTGTGKGFLINRDGVSRVG